MTEAELVLMEILDCDRISLCQNRQQRLDREESLKLSQILKRRISAEPIQYILGKTEFMGLEFECTPDVLIPRQETEILVEVAVGQLKAPACRQAGQSSKLKELNILELGTGSGCIAVSLAKLISNANICATDISEQALAIARHNARLNRVSDKIRFIQSDLFSSSELRAMSYGLIISNPPYIPTQEIDRLQSEIRYEPRIALDGGKDGLDFYRNIISGSASYLKQGGFLILEIGIGQKDEIKNIFQNSGDFEIIDIVKDYSRIDRVIVAKRKNKYG